jgi:hypothetical protein
MDGRADAGDRTRARTGNRPRPNACPVAACGHAADGGTLARMIELFDETLKDLVTREVVSGGVVSGGQVEVAFDAPTREWAARRNAPTLNLYLYDIRDDLERRETQWEEVRDPAGRVTERRPPARRFRLSYMITAWTQRPEDEHRLLSACLAAFLRHEALAPRELAGALRDQPWAVELAVALPPREDRSIADVWTALGGELKPSIDLAASVPFVVDRRQPAGPPVLEMPRITVAGTDAPHGLGARRGPAARDATGSGVTRAAPSPASVAEETVAGGATGQPGRLLRMHGAVRRP